MKKPKRFVLNDPTIKKEISKTITVRAYIMHKKTIAVETFETNKDLKQQLKEKEVALNFNPPYGETVKVVVDHADRSGQWSWNQHRDWCKCPKSGPIMNQFLHDYHNTKTWGDVIMREKRSKKKKGKSKNTAKHVFYEIDQICKEARDRLVEIQKDDQERIFRFRLSRTFRVFGFTLGDQFITVWHDPKHNIYDD